MGSLKKIVRSFPRYTSTVPGKDELDTTFNNTIDAFKSKRTSELCRALVVYQLCSINWLVENNTMLMRRCRQIFGQRIFETIMKATFYGQFVAGESPDGIKPTIDLLSSFGVKSILDYSVEEDLTKEEAERREKIAMTSGSSVSKEEANMKQYQVEMRAVDRRSKVISARTYFYMDEAACEQNMEHFLKSIDAVHKTTKSTGLMGIKLTSLGRPQLLLQLSEVIMRARLYMQQLGTDGRGNVLTHNKTVEDFKRYFGENKDKPEVQEFLKKITTDDKGVVHLFPWSNILNEDMNLNDSFRVPDPKTGQLRRLTSQISSDQQKMFRNMLRRLNNIIAVANDLDVRVMIDAEQTYFQPAISRICMEMMRKYNKDRYLIFNTYQTYLKNAYDEIVADLEQARRQKFWWAAKTVRGAYLEQERARSEAMGYADPTCPSFEATSASYHRCLHEIVGRTKGEMKGKIAVMVASHNEDTVRESIALMKKLSIKPEEKVVCFGQLLGMCDHVTFPLGQAGYSAYKYVPYGPVVEVLPYLSRRANENRGFLSKIKKEKKLLFKEIIRRLFSGTWSYKPKGNYKPV